MQNKKAISAFFQFLIIFVVIIAAAIIYLVWLKDFRIHSENLADYTICKNSNLENAKLKLKVPYTNQVLDERKDIIGNKCKTEYVPVPEGRELDTIARKMARCWDMYLEGKEEIFETSDNNYCAICSVLTFDNKKEMKGLTQYLIGNDISGNNKKYFNYLNSIIVTNDVLHEIENSHLNDLHTIDTSKSQAVIFTMYKDAYPGSWTGYSSTASAVGGATAGPILTTLAVVTGYGLCSTGVGCLIGAFLVGVGGGGAIGYAIGSGYGPDMNTKVLLWPYSNEDLSKLDCTMLEGKDRLDIKKF